MNKFAVVWDWNGTIVNDAPLFVDIMNVFLKERSLDPINVRIYRECFEFPVINYYRRLGFDFNKESFESLGFRFIDMYKKKRFDAPLFTGVKDIIQKLFHAGCTQLVVSAQENSLLSSSVKYYGLSDFFCVCRGVDNIYAKGKVDLALSLKKEFLDGFDDVFVVGDSLKDFSMSLALKASPVLLSYGHYAKHRLPEKNCVILDSVSSLGDFFLRKIKRIK